MGVWVDGVVTTMRRGGGDDDEEGGTFCLAARPTDRAFYLFSIFLSCLSSYLGRREGGHGGQRHQGGREGGSGALAQGGLRRGAVWWWLS